MRENSDFVATVSHSLRSLPEGWVVELDLPNTPRTFAHGSIKAALQAAELLAQEHGKTLGMNKGVAQ